MSGFPSRFFLGLPLLVLLAVAPPLRAQTPAPSATPAATPSALPPLKHMPFTLNLSTDSTPAPGSRLLDTPEPPSQFVPPKLLKRLPVSYPELAHLNRVEGVVHVQFSIDEAGHVTRAIVTRSSGSVQLDAIVRDYTLTQWQFAPATFKGVPVPSTKDQDFEFRLDPEEEKAIALKRLALPIGTPNAPYPKEALALKLRGSVTVGVHWTKAGLVDLIYLPKASGSNILDRAALRWAYENWHIDPAMLNDKNKDEPFTKTMTFEPPK